MPNFEKLLGVQKFGVGMGPRAVIGWSYIYEQCPKLTFQDIDPWSAKKSTLLIYQMLLYNSWLQQLHFSVHKSKQLFFTIFAKAAMPRNSFLIVLICFAVWQILTEDKLVTQSSNMFFEDNTNNKNTSLFWKTGKITGNFEMLISRSCLLCFACSYNYIIALCH